MVLVSAWPGQAQEDLCPAAAAALSLLQRFEMLLQVEIGMSNVPSVLSLVTAPAAGISPSDSKR